VATPGQAGLRVGFNELSFASHRTITCLVPRPSFLSIHLEPVQFTDLFSLRVQRTKDSTATERECAKKSRVLLDMQPAACVESLTRSLCFETLVHDSDERIAQIDEVRQCPLAPSRRGRDGIRDDVVRRES